MSHCHKMWGELRTEASLKIKTGLDRWHELQADRTSCCRGNRENIFHLCYQPAAQPSTHFLSEHNNTTKHAAPSKRLWNCVIVTCLCVFCKRNHTFIILCFKKGNKCMNFHLVYWYKAENCCKICLMKLWTPLALKSVPCNHILNLLFLRLVMPI